MLNMRFFAVLMTAAVAIGCGGGSEVIKPGTMPDGGDFTGVWHSQEYGEMHLVQDGNHVHGRYELDERRGKISGDIDGDLLHFEWREGRELVSNRPTETIGHGYFRYEVDPGNGDHLLKGRWGLGEDNQLGGTWNAYKMKNREPDLGETEGGESEDVADDVDVPEDDMF